jgi:hypothetical protein
MDITEETYYKKDINQDSIFETMCVCAYVHTCVQGNSPLRSDIFC